MKRIASLLAVGTLSAFWSVHATAAWIQIDYRGFVKSPEHGSIGGIASAGVKAGMFEFDVEQDPDNVYWDATLQAFCIDVQHVLQTSNSYYHFRDASYRFDSPQLSLIGKLYDLYALNLGTDGDHDAAFQLALWEIVYDYDYGYAAYDYGDKLNLTKGDFWAKNFDDAQTTAQGWLTSLEYTENYVSSKYEFFVLEPKSPTNNQALLVWRDRVQVPEPGTLALLGIGLLAFAPSLRASRRGRRAPVGLV